MAKKTSNRLEYTQIVDELLEIEKEHERIDFKITSLKSMLARYVEAERNKK